MQPRFDHVRVPTSSIDHVASCLETICDQLREIQQELGRLENRPHSVPQRLRR